MVVNHNLISLLSPWVELNESVLEKNLVQQLELDSRNIKAGHTFIAIKGHAVDGRQFIDKAIENGATSVIAQACENHPHGLITYKNSCPIIFVSDLDSCLSELAGRLYRSTSTLVAVTGTNGKTTITQLIAQWIELLEKKAAVMGTTGNGFLDALEVAKNTTGNAVEIQKSLSQLSDLGANYTALEVSSHGLIQGRVSALPFEVGVFTNLSRDHLDYHGTMESYADAKMGLFTRHQCNKAVINADDPIGEKWLGTLTEAVAVSIEKPLTQNQAIWADSVKYSDDGISISLNGSWGEGKLSAPLIGAFNASNLMLAFATLLSLGFDKQRLLDSARNLQPVIGRMELFQSENRARIVVDYAHTPDALEKALSALRVHCSGKLWVIFGCGGDRDKGKRPMMAAIAEKLADHVILTDDNPRSENEVIIVEDMLEGMTSPGSALIEHDRYKALQLAFERSDSGDIILLAGKGHEDYQVLKDKTIHYSDRESAIELLGLQA